MNLSLIIMFLLSALAGRAAKPKDCVSKDCASKEFKRPKDRGGIALAVAGLVIFHLGGIGLPLIAVAAVPGFLVGRFKQKNWVAYSVAGAAIVAALWLLN